MPGCHNSLRKDYEHVRLQAVRELSDREPIHPFAKSPRREHRWLRGLPQVIEVDRPIGRDASLVTKVRGNIKVYTDGGAVFLADPELRRSGWGMWVSEWHELNCLGVVPVVEQTAGRAEFDAAVR
eukprot:3933845-Heterocapsa_arctica.AAC.1